MKTKFSFLMCLMLLIITSAFSQEKSKKELKAEESLRKQAEIESLINTKNFVFVARWAYPAGARQVDLTSNPNYVRFNPDLFDGFMPFFGQGYSGMGFGGDNGIKFKDKPMEYTIEKKKKNFQIDAKVKGENDIYRLSLSVSFEGIADLSVISNNRSSIRYSGEIMPPERHEK